jgi:hypothetical protein
MNISFIPLDLLVNTTTYYGPLEYTVQLTNKTSSLNLTFNQTFEFFSKTIPNTINQIIESWPEIKKEISKLDIYDSVTFNVTINCWTAKDAHLITFAVQQLRFKQSFEDKKVISVRELKQEYCIFDERERQVKTCLENLTNLFELSPTQEYLIVELFNQGLGVESVSNYSTGYKCLYKILKLDLNLQNLQIHFVVIDYYNLANKCMYELGSEYILSVKLPDSLPESLDNLFECVSSHICVKVPKLGSENFTKYLQLVDKLKNWSKYNQIDTFAKEIATSKSKNYIEYVNKKLGCETKINNSIINESYVEQFIIPDVNFKNLNLIVPYNTNDQLEESFY